MTREDILNNWLEKINSRSLWKTNVVAIGSLTCYAVNGKIFLVQRYEEGGWDIYIPADQTNRVDNTFRTVEAYLGIKE